MARVNGRNGAIYVSISSAGVPEPLPFAKKWSASFATSMDDATAFGDANKVYTSGLPEGSGSFEGWYDSATAQTFTAAADGIARKCYFYPTTASSSGPYWYGTAFFDFSIDVDISGGTVPISGNWTPAGDLTKLG